MTRRPCDVDEDHLGERAEPEHGLAVGVLGHPDLGRNPRLRLFRDMVGEALQRQKHTLEGRAAPPR